MVEPAIGTKSMVEQLRRDLELYEGAFAELQDKMQRCRAAIAALTGEPMPAARSGRGPNVSYVPRVIELMERTGRPMSVAEMARELGMVREKLERSVWMDVNRKKKPRLKKLGRALYWIAGKPLPKGVKAA